MRWKFPDPSEDKVRRQELARFDAFWASFPQTAAALSGATEAERRAAAETFGEQVRALHPQLSWEMGRDTPAGDEHYLALTFAGRRPLLPLAEAIVGRAPRLPGWRFTPFRTAKGLAAASQYLAHVAPGRADALDAWNFRIEEGEHRLITVHCGVPGCQGPRDREAHLAALAVTDALLGEEAFTRWVGEVHIRTPEENAGEPLGELPARFEELRGAMVGRLPATPVTGQGAEASWSLFKFNPRRRDDYRGRQDLYVGKSMMAELWRCVHQGVMFSSARFSRVGEVFCYLKIDGDAGFGEGGFEDKTEAEDALDEALGEARLGGVIGGGSGLRYSYIDLALLDVPAAFEVIRRVLKEGKAPRRTWLLFLDDELRHEWLGLGPRTPAPPGLG